MVPLVFGLFIGFAKEGISLEIGLRLGLRISSNVFVKSVLLLVTYKLNLPHSHNFWEEALLYGNLEDLLLQEEEFLAHRVYTKAL